MGGPEGIGRKPIVNPVAPADRPGLDKKPPEEQRPDPKPRKEEEPETEDTQDKEKGQLPPGVGGKVDKSV